MANVNVRIPQSHVVVRHTGIEFEVRDSNNRIIGTLLVNTAGVAWAPRGAWLRGQPVRSRRKNWEQLHNLFYP